jgi:hypothetical protein
MKKLIYILLLCLPFAVRAQVADIIVTKPAPSTGINRNNQTAHYANAAFDLNLRVPRALNWTLNGAKDSIGYIMFNISLGRYGMYFGGGNWRKITFDGDHISALDNDAGYLTANSTAFDGRYLQAYNEYDPSVSEFVKGITSRSFAGVNGENAQGSWNINITGDSYRAVTANSALTSAAVINGLGNMIFQYNAMAGQPAFVWGSNNSNLVNIYNPADFHVKYADSASIAKSFLNQKAVATTGSYNDLTNKPVIPATQIQSNWTQTDPAAPDYINNKPAAAGITIGLKLTAISDPSTVNNIYLAHNQAGVTTSSVISVQATNASAALGKGYAHIYPADPTLIEINYPTGTNAGDLHTYDVIIIK